MIGLTDRQREVLEAVIAHLLEHHTHAPIRTICEAVGIRSTNGVNDHLRALARKGYLEHVPKPCGGVGGHYRVRLGPDGEPFELGRV